MQKEYLDAEDLEERTGTKAATWYYWALKGEGPPSLKIGRRRVWKRTVFDEWLAEQEAAAK